MLPNRLEDFVRYYEKPKSRKNIDYENYRIEDCLHGLRVTRLGEVVVDGKAGGPLFDQQLAILNAVKARFESSLYDIKQLVQADLFDSELDAATALLTHGFMRAAGALAGVVLERHLTQVCENHLLVIGKKNPVISDLNDALKNSGVIDVPNWRFTQHLADIRNMCDHNKKQEPTVDQVNDLILGVSKISKVIF